MANPADFIQLHCANTDAPTCATCGRDFIIPVSAIAGIFRMQDGSAEVLFKHSGFCMDPNCFNNPIRFRFVKTTANWATIVALLEGKVANLGNCNMVQESF